MTTETLEVLHRWQTNSKRYRYWCEINPCDNGMFCVSTEASNAFMPTLGEALEWAERGIALDTRTHSRKWRKVI